jgi:site-specific recombinase XerD
MFLRYLAFKGKSPKGLEYALPSLTMPCPQKLPKYLPPAKIEELIASCDEESKVGIRDRAILLVLARLGLRAGEAANLCLSDISWEEASLRVRGKVRHENLLPLPQDVGDAILRYLECARPRVECEHLFLTCIAPFQPFASGISLSLVVRRALNRAGIDAPAKGAHLLRHSLATELLGQEVSLQEIATVLRHQSIKTTTVYTKVDVALLKSVVQPWPGGADDDARS